MDSHQIPTEAQPQAQPEELAPEDANSTDVTSGSLADKVSKYAHYDRLEG